jgi:adenylate cyclase
MDAPEPSPAYEMASVLFMDIVSYSLKTMDEQTELLTALQRIVRESAEFQLARASDALISLPAGDGMALVFLRDPIAPVRCALEIAASLKNRPEIQLRMGVHAGPVRRHADIKDQINVVGGGVNTAQRVMDCGDAGHILLSRNSAEVLEQVRGWSHCLQNLGVQEIKHGVKLQLFNLCKDGLGNPARPRKLSARAAAAPRRQWPLWRRVLAGFIAVSLCTALAAFAMREVGVWRAAHSGPSVRSVAVLSFVNVGQDPNWEYLADGLTESMINRLSRIRDLTVMSRSAVFRIKARTADAIEEGRLLGVDAVLTGSVRHYTDHLEASVQLIDCATGRHLWGEHYRQAFVDALTFEKSAAEDTGSQLRTQLDQTEKQGLARNYTENTDAYRFYLKGRYEWNKRTVQGYEQAIRYFRQALDSDPGYALAYAGIADAYSTQSGHVPSGDIFPKAKAAADRALQIDPDLAEAHASLGFIYVQYDWDWVGAEAEFRRALQLNPSYPSAHSMYARLLCVLGRFPEAETETAKAQKLDPLSIGIANGVGYELYLARDFARAEKQFKSNLKSDANSAVTRSYLALTLSAAGRAAEAVPEYERILAADPSDLNTMADLARAYALAGRKEDAARLYDRLKGAAGHQTLLPTSLAGSDAALGRVDEAFAELERAYSEKCWYLIFLKVEPLFDPLRKDPRYNVLLRKMNLG